MEPKWIAKDFLSKKKITIDFEQEVQETQQISKVLGNLILFFFK